MSEKRRKFDQDFKDGAVRIVLESGRPVAEIARELDVHEGTLGNWVTKAKARQEPGALRESERDELGRLRKENAELRMQRDVLKRSVVLWVDWPRSDGVSASALSTLARPMTVLSCRSRHRGCGRLAKHSRS